MTDLATSVLYYGDSIDALMKASTRDLFPMFYDAAQTAGSVQYIAAVDRSLIEDGTYSAVERQ